MTQARSLHRLVTWTSVSVGLLAGLPLAMAVQSNSQGGLFPVDPKDAQGVEVPEASADGFDAATWASRLADADLDRREEAFEALLQRAQGDPQVRGWLKQQADGGGELAWTARLALRDLRQAPARGARDPFDGLLQQRRLAPLGVDGLFQLRPNAGGRTTLFDDLFRQLGPGAATPMETRSRSGIQMRWTPQGVVVEVTENMDGEEKVQSYEAESLDALFEAHPELRDRVGNVRMLRGGSLFQPNQAPEAGPRTDVLGVRVAAQPAGNGRPAGLLVYDAELGTIAHLLGLSRGDLLLRMNGVPLERVEQISEVLGARPDDGEVRLTWLDVRGRETTRVWRPTRPE